MQAIIVADGDVRDGSAVRRALSSTGGENHAHERLVIAADGGALKAEALGLKPHVVVGDGDSLDAARAAQLRASGVEVLVHSADKDESDTELALREALARGAGSIVLLGALGGARVEHGVANLLLLALPELARLDALIADGPSEVRVIGAGGPAKLRIEGTPRDFVSLLPLSERVDGVSTSGLRFALEGETLVQGPARGLSNELLGTEAVVHTERGSLAVIHTDRSEVELP